MRHENDFFFFLTEWSFRKVQCRRQQILHGHTGATDQWWPQMKVTSKGVKCTIGPWAAQWQGRPSSHQVFGYTSAFKMKCYWMIKQVYNRWTNRFHVKILLLECKPFICAWKLRYRNGLFLTFLMCPPMIGRASRVRTKTTGLHIFTFLNFKNSWSVPFLDRQVPEIPSITEGMACVTKNATSKKNKNASRKAPHKS